MKNLIKLQEFKSVFNEKIDLFICSSSFEERCFSLPNVIKDISPQQTLIIFNKNEYQEIIYNADKIQVLFGKKTTKVAISSDEPIKSSQLINSSIEDVFKKKIDNILLDATTFTHESLLVIIKLLYFRKDRFKKLFVGYVGANDYSLNEEKLEDKWLSNGIKEIRSVLGYPGSLSPARNYHLIILFGFELERTKKLIDESQFDRISIGFGYKGKSIQNKFQELNCDRHKELVKSYPLAEEFEISLIDPYEARDKILEQAQKYPNYNIIVAPMNNKISTVGASLAAIINPKIQIIYAKSVNYNVNGYSTPKDDCYIFEVKFNYEDA